MKYSQYQYLPEKIMRDVYSENLLRREIAPGGRALWPWAERKSLILFLLYSSGKGAIFPMHPIHKNVFPYGTDCRNSVHKYIRPLKDVTLSHADVLFTIFYIQKTFLCEPCTKTKMVGATLISKQQQQH